MNKMKKNNKKGFSLVEMLIVIAIIAVLVSIAIPVTKYSTTKARAATNAANLRSIEGEVAMMMNLNFGDFEEYLDQGEDLERVSGSILGKFWDFCFGNGAAAQTRIKYNTLAENGKFEIIIPRSGEKIRNVARAKAVTAKHRNGGEGLTVEKDTGMIVYISEEGAMATYNGFSATDFADVAEDGIYDGELKGAGGSGGTGIGGAIIDGIFGDGTTDKVEDFLEALSCRSTSLDGKHTPGAGCKCPYCGEVAHVDADRSTSWGMISYDSSSTRHACSCGTVFNANHKYASGSHECVYVDCTEGDIGCQDVVNTNKADHKCDICGKVMSECTYEEYSKQQHSCSVCGKKQNHVNSNNDHNCDICNYAYTNGCSDKTGDGNHNCDYCGATIPDQCKDSNKKDHKCDECGTTMSQCSDKTGDKDHKCDVCGKTMSECSDKTGDGNHNCDECNKSGVSKCSDVTGDGNHTCDECGKNDVSDCTYVNDVCTECNDKKTGC